MPTFTFEGFTENSLVTLSAAQGIQGASSMVPEWGLSNMNTATIDIARIEPAELVAPVGIWFEATGLSGFSATEDLSGGYDPAAHEIIYVWDFDDPGTFGSHLNVPAAWNNSGIDYGKRAYHVFDKPGIYNVELWAVDNNGTTGVRTISIEVLDPNLAYPSTRTVCVSNQGDFTGAPPGAVQVSTIGTAIGVLQSAGQTGRILLRRGETFEEGNRIDSMVNCRIGSFGDEADLKPILYPPIPEAGATGWGATLRFGNGNTVYDSAFYDLRFQGDWDAAKETGDSRMEAIATWTHNNPDGFNLLIYRCEFDGIQGLYAVPGQGCMYGIVDTQVTNFQDYALFLGSIGNPENARYAFVGSSFTSKEDACEGGYGRNGELSGLSNAQGCLRYGNLKYLIASACDFYSASSWTGSVQPCARFAGHEDGASDAPADGYVIQLQRVVMEGGDVLFGWDGGRTTTEIPGNQICDMLLLVGSYSTTRWSSTSYGGTTIRNAIYLLPDMNRSRGGGTFMSLDQRNPGAGNAGAPMRFYNNTYLNQTNEVLSVSFGSGEYSNILITNNIDHQPGAGVTTFAPIDLTQTIVGFRPKNRGRRRSPDKVQTPVSGVGPGGTFIIGYPDGTGQADYQTSGRHTVKVAGGSYFSHRGHCTLTFGASEITVRNDSPNTWTGTATLGLDQATLVTDAFFGTPEMVPLPVPIGDSQALTDGGGLQVYTQFDTGQRTRPKGAV